MIHFSPMRTFMPDPLPSIKGKVVLITWVMLRKVCGREGDSSVKKPAHSPPNTGIPCSNCYMEFWGIEEGRRNGE